jgi:hypothetical protein
MKRGSAPLILIDLTKDVFKSNGSAIAKGVVVTRGQSTNIGFPVLALVNLVNCADILASATRVAVGVFAIEQSFRTFPAVPWVNRGTRIGGVDVRPLIHQLPAATMTVEFVCLQAVCLAGLSH